jgi:hypothetical protein
MVREACYHALAAVAPQIIRLRGPAAALLAAVSAPVPLWQAVSVPGCFGRCLSVAWRGRVVSCLVPHQGFVLPRACAQPCLFVSFCLCVRRRRMRGWRWQHSTAAGRSTAGLNVLQLLNSSCVSSLAYDMACCLYGRPTWTPPWTFLGA